MNVRAWEEKVVIPTYPVGEPVKHPMFFEKRIYQGSSGSVYPYPVIEKISDVKEDRAYTAVYLENKYLKIMILPELGGRVQMAYDKIRQRHFIYYNQVIKPALVGLCGPWISGGIEFNWPQHHRPGTFSPTNYTIENNSDGSSTVWVSEIERMSHTKGMAGFVLHPDKAYLEIRAKIHNRSSLPQTFLWWANPAVKVNEHYQSVFPPDVNAVFDHGKRDVSEFPIAKGVYYKVDYAPGTDISRYKNIPVPTSYMAVQSKFDFIGCYEHDTKAGMLHVADHHIAPGKKQWTWGNSDFGISWDRNLTDEDGPYIELMTGVFTENQPDFAWLQPNEEKTFEQYFMPYAGIGAVKNAVKEAMVNLEPEGNKAVIGVYVTAEYANATVRLLAGAETIAAISTDLNPETYFTNEVLLPTSVSFTDLLLEVRSNNGHLLISYQPEDYSSKEIPAAATAAPDPAEVPTVEQLYLHGLHLEQYRHATFDPMDYYEEALRREPGDSRTNNAVGLLLLRRGQFAKALPYFQLAIRTLTNRNNNPHTGEAHYNLGLCYRMLERLDEAYDAFYKSIWNDAFQHSGYLELARLAARRKEYTLALQHIGRSLVRNSESHTARHLKAVLLRKTGNTEAAKACINDALKQDPFSFGCLFEQAQLTNDVASTEQLQHLMQSMPQQYLEFALDYAHAGFYEEAATLLQLHTRAQKEVYPMVLYCLGWLHQQMSNPERALQYFRQAGQQKPDYCFPNKPEELIMLQSALQLNSGDAKAWYYLGNLWYARKQYAEAVECWEHSIELDDHFPTVLRNLALACFNKLNDPKRCLQLLEKAFGLQENDARLLMELDQLYKILNYPAADRLATLKKYQVITEERDDLYLEMITLYNSLGEYSTARKLILSRNFHPWEGGEGRVISQYLLCHIELAKRSIMAKRYKEAMVLLEAADQYPPNLGEGKLPNAQINAVSYLKGIIYQATEEETKANACFAAATTGAGEPALAMYYNDASADQLFYQALAYREAGNSEKAISIFNQLIQFGLQHWNDTVAIEYFAVSLPDLAVFEQDLNQKNRQHCNYLTGLGELGLNNMDRASEYFSDVLKRDTHHQGAMIHRNMIPFLQNRLQNFSIEK